MKIGRYSRFIKDFARYRNMHINAIKALIYLDENMWADSNELKYHIVCDMRAISPHLKTLRLRGYIRIARHETNTKDMTRKYCITDKGKELVRIFKQKLNQ